MCAKNVAVGPSLGLYLSFACDLQKLFSPRCLGPVFQNVLQIAVLGPGSASSSPLS